MRNKIVFVLAYVVASVSAFASQSKISGTTYSGHNNLADFYIMNDGVSTRGGYAYGWYIADYYKPEMDPRSRASYQSSLVQLEIDCAAGKTRELHASAFSGPKRSGREVYSVDLSLFSRQPDAKAFPGTAVFSIARTICNKAGLQW